MKILMVAGTTFELYYLSSITCLLKTKDPFLEFRLFLRYHFEPNITPEIRSLYSKIDLLEIPALTPRVSKNPFRMLQNIFINFAEYWTFRIYMKKTLADVDIVCVSGFREFFANVMCRLAPDRVRLIALRLANERLEKTRDYRERPLFSFLFNIKNVLLGYSPMHYKWKRDSFDLVMKNFRSYPYHRTISITDYDLGEKDSFFRLPPPFVALKTRYRVDDEKPAILVAGDKTPVHESWTNEDQKKYEAVFNFLRENYKDHKLFFKPKIGRTDPTQYNLENFEVLRPEISLEEICLRNNVKKVISIRSTSSKVGIYFGIPGYLLYPLFNLPYDFIQSIENEHYDMRSVVRVTALEDLKKEPPVVLGEYDFDDLASLYMEAIVT